MRELTGDEFRSFETAYQAAKADISGPFHVLNLSLPYMLLGHAPGWLFVGSQLDRDAKMQNVVESIEVDLELIGLRYHSHSPPRLC